MIHHEYIADLDLQYFYCVDPFDLDSLLDKISRLTQSSGPERDVSNLTLYDLRSVNVHLMTGPQFERFIRRRLELGSNTTGNPCAFIVGDMASFGMIRMYGAMAEFRGLRDENQSFITTAVGEAIDWIERRLPNVDRDQVLRVLTQAETRGAAITPTVLPLVRQQAPKPDAAKAKPAWGDFSRTFL